MSSTAADAQAFHKRLHSQDMERAAQLFPGAAYRDVLSWLHRFGKPRSYLEIGVRNGRSLACVEEGTIAVGIDPEIDLDPKFKTKSILFVETSDEFFSRPDPLSLFGGERVQLSFIDGLHTYEQTLRDFINIEAVSAPDSLIILHDLMPLDDRVGNRTRQSIFWTGDVWKVLPILSTYRPDLSLTFVPCAPSGMVLATGLDPNSTVLNDRFDEAVEGMRAEAYSDSYRQAAWNLPTCANTDEAVEAFVRSLWPVG